MKAIKGIAIVFLIAGAFAAGFGFGRWYGPKPSKTGERKILYYVDPMHPAYKSDRPGIAPDCGMKLEPVYADSGTAPRETAERKILHYRDPKAPEYTSDHPGINPETGNDLEAVYAVPASPLPMGTIQVSPEKQQMIGVQFGVAEYTTAGEAIRAVGKVAVDETRVVRVHPKVEGWIQKVHVDFIGAEIHKGQPLLTLYSPEMFASQQEYLLSIRARDVMGQSGAIESAITNSKSLIEASRRRLELWDLSRAQIEEVERTGKAIRSITIFAPSSGFVTARNSFPGQRVNMDTELYAISDLSRIWVMADVFENDISKVHIGQTATIRMQGGGALSAHVSYLQPQVDPQTRTLKVRLEAPNAGLKLKPDMFVEVELPVASTRRLTVLADAVLDSGDKQMVFVDRGNGNLEPRQVQIGDRLGDTVAILGGLKAGERIVTSANFLIDSESQLKSAMAGMGGHQHGATVTATERSDSKAQHDTQPPPGPHRHD